jgi:hypothetical protein
MSDIEKTDQKPKKPKTSKSSKKAINIPKTKVKKQKETLEERANKHKIIEKYGTEDIEDCLFKYLVCKLHNSKI